MQEDTYKTIQESAEAIYTEKRSKFIAIALPVRTLSEVKSLLEEYQKKYYDARHVCYAYMLGAERKDFRANDNGEPSGTAGKPILGQINSRELTDVLVIVVRYFGGIKLGTSGLIVAYRMAASLALDEAPVIEKTVDEDVAVAFEYPFMNDIMRIVKEESPEILEQVVRHGLPDASAHPQVDDGKAACATGKSGDSPHPGRVIGESAGSRVFFTESR